jgi:hypothetical protein
MLRLHASDVIASRISVITCPKKLRDFTEAIVAVDGY